MGPDRSRLAGRPGRVPGHRRRVPGLGGVVHDGRQVGAVAVQQRGQHPLVQLDPAGRRQGICDGAADQLVPETHPGRRHCDQPVPLGRGQRRDAAPDQAVDQPPVQGGRHDGQLLQGVLGRRVDGPGAREHRVDDGRRRMHGVTGRDDLGDEERVAGGDRVHVAGVEAARGAQLADRISSSR
jgi:hypothetical protein